MFRAIFQFVPSHTPIDGETHIEEVDLDFQQKATGFWESVIGDNRILQVDSTGNIRYVFNLESLESDILISEFERAMKIVFQETGLKSSNFQTCLILEGESVVSEYLDKNNEIGDFSRDQFADYDWEYREIDDTKIKLSFDRFTYTNPPTL